MLTRTKMLVRLLGPLAMVIASGCAPAYHDYSGCHIDCRYCPPPPLPYACYPDCVCHSCAASNYLSVAPLGTDEIAPADSDNETLLHESDFR